MLAAAEAWGSLANGLYSAANSYGSAIAALSTGSWVGPSSTLMAGAAATYVAWMSRTAAAAEQTADQAMAAAAAYEAAFSATVPPEIVAANRIQLMVLVATNLFGQNTPAIAATEAQYSEMWAQDTGAMYGYAGSAASATQVMPFDSPQQTVNPAAAAAQSLTVGQAGATDAGSAQSVVSQFSQFFSAVPNQLAGLASADVIGSYSPTDILDVGADLIAFVVDAPMSPLGAISLPIDVIGAQTGIHSDDIISGWADLGFSPVGAGLPDLASATTSSSGMVSAGWNEANTVGGLSVPPTWTAATPAVRPVALALPQTSIGIDSQALTSSLGDAVGDMAMATAAGRALGDTLGARGGQRARAAIATRKPASAEPMTTDDDASTDTEPRIVVTGIAAEIREFAKLRDEGLISPEQYIEQRNRLLGL